MLNHPEKSYYLRHFNNLLSILALTPHLTHLRIVDPSLIPVTHIED